MKKPKFTIIALFAIFMSLTLFGQPTPATTIEIPTEVSCGVYDVDVTVQDFTNVGAASLVLNFNSPSSVFTYRTPAVTLHTALSSASTNVSIPGQFRLGYNGSGSAVTLNDNDVLFTLHFDLLPISSGGTTNLTWSTVPNDCEYAGPNGSPVYTSTFNDLIWTIPVRPVKNTTTLLEYCKIQDAINDPLTLDGHTITVAAGTYFEAGQIVIDKNLTLTGADKNTTIIKPDHNTTIAGYVQSDAWIYVASGISFNLSNFTLDGRDLSDNLQTIRHAIQSRGELTVEHCIIQHIHAAIYYGRGIVLLAGASNYINDVSMNHIQRIGIHIRGGVELTNPYATVMNFTYVGKGAIDCLDYGIEFGGGGQGVVGDISTPGSGCNITNCYGIASTDGSTSAGILITDYYGTGTIAEVYSSVLTNNSYGIAVGYDTPDISIVTAHNNQIYGNTDYGIYALENTVIDAENNWWGSDTGPYNDPYNTCGSGNEVAGPVDFMPWWEDAAMTISSGDLPVHNTTKGTYYCTIQDAVQDANPTGGNDITVAVGTYFEAGQIVIDKNLTLTGADKNTTIIKPDHNTTIAGYVQSDAWIYVASGISFNLSNFTLDGRDLSDNLQTIRHAIQSRGELTVEHCIIQHIHAAIYYGRGIVLLAGASNYINDVSMNHIQRIGIHIRGGVELTNPYATVMNFTYVGKGAIDCLDYGIEFGGGGQGVVGDILITGSGCNITNCYGIASVDGSTSAGILITDYYGTFTIAEVYSSVLTDNSYGIVVGYAAPDISVLTARNNKIYGNTVYGIEALENTSVDAKENWWGDASGPYHAVNNTCGSGNEVTDYVAFMPWWEDAAMTISSGDLPVSNISNSPVTYYCKIQDAIDDINTTDGNEIQVALGSYTESLTINKELTINGIDKATRTLTGDHTITANNVTLTNFTFVPASPAITIDASAAAVSGISITNSIFNLTSGGIGIWIGGSSPSFLVSNITISGNTFNGPADKIANPMKIGGYFGTGISCQVDNLDFTGNTVDKASIPLNLQDANLNDLLFDDNTFTNTDGLVYVWSQGTPTTAVLSNFVFTNNTANSTNSYGVGIGLVNGSGSFSDANYGTGNMVNNNNFVNIPGAYGFKGVSILGATSYVLDATCNWWGSTNAYDVADDVSDNVQFLPFWTTSSGPCDGVGPVVNISNDPQTSFMTITAAINDTDTDDGEIIVVAAGTYAENVDIDKQLSFRGAQYNVDARGRTATESVITASSGHVITLNDINITIDGFQITGTGTASRLVNGDSYGSYLVLKNNILDGIATNVGLWFNATSPNITFEQNYFNSTLIGEIVHFDSDQFNNLTIKNNNFFGGSIAATNTLSTAYNSSNMLMEGNEFDGTSMNLYTKFALSVIKDNVFLNNGYTHAQVGLQESTISGNTFYAAGPSPNAGYPSYALMLWGDQYSVLSPSNNVTIENNYFYFNNTAAPGELAHGLRIFSGIDASTISVNNNSFIDQGQQSGTFAVRNQGTNTLPATCNWWGSFCGSDIAPMISGPANFTPWLIGGNDGTGIGFQPLDPCTGVFPELSSVTLQARVDAAGPPWDYLVSGDLSGGYSMCIIPSVTNYYLDINVLTSSPALGMGILNPFTLTASTPANWWTYWAAKGVVSGATGWQGQMWEIINGNAPFFYIKYTTSPDYILVDGLQYWLAQQPTPNPGAEPILTVPGDYPNHTYTYTGDVTDVNGCVSLPISVVMSFNACDITGTLKYNNTAQTGLNNMIVTLNSTPAVSATTGAGGAYTLNSVPSGTYTITFNDNGKTTGGINATDAAQANYWGVAAWQIEKVRFFAGDVNNDNFVLAADAGLILQYFVNAGNPPYNFTTIWKFWLAGDMISANPYAGPADPSVTIGSSSGSQNLYGLCTGDFNQSFTPGTTKEASESLTLNYGKTIYAEVGDELELPIYTGMDMDLGAVSLILNFPSDKVDISDVFLTSDPSSPLMYNISGDELRIGWNSLIPAYLDKGESLITLKMKVINESGEEGISMSLVADPLNELADENFFVINDAVLIADVIHTSALGIANNMADKLAFANHPNPFKGTTNFVYSLPVDGKVILEIYDLVGNKVKTAVDETQTAGEYTVKLETNRLQPGVYTATLRLSNEDSKLVSTIKILSR